MATLLDADLPSDDEADEDFNPTGVEFASESARPKRGLMELSDDDGDATQPSAGAGLHRMLADGLADAMDEARYTQPPPGASSEDEEGGKRRKAPAKKQKLQKKAAKQQAGALAELRSTQRSAKVDAVWAALRRGTTAAATPKLAGSSEAAAAHGDVAGTTAAAAGGDAVLGGGEAAAEGGQGATGAMEPAKRNASFSVASLCREVKKPSKHGDDRAWMKQLGMFSKPLAAFTAAGSSSTAARSAATAALAAAKAATSTTAAQHHGSVKVVETRRFAGKDVQMERSVLASEASKSAAHQQAASGLDAMLAAIGGAKKVNVLDKSRADWGVVKKDSAVEAELEEYKKSGGKYLDRVDFLKRAELREYEKERDARLGADVRNRGRL